VRTHSKIVEKIVNDFEKFNMKYD